MKIWFLLSGTSVYIEIGSVNIPWLPTRIRQLWIRQSCCLQGTVAEKSDAQRNVFWKWWAQQLRMWWGCWRWPPRDHIWLFHQPAVELSLKTTFHRNKRKVSNSIYLLWINSCSGSVCDEPGTMLDGACSIEDRTESLPPGADIPGEREYTNYFIKIYSVFLLKALEKT